MKNSLDVHKVSILDIIYIQFISRYQSRRFSLPLFSSSILHVTEILKWSSPKPMSTNFRRYSFTASKKLTTLFLHHHRSPHFTNLLVSDFMTISREPQQRYLLLGVTSLFGGIWILRYRRGGDWLKRVERTSHGRFSYVVLVPMDPPRRRRWYHYIPTLLFINRQNSNACSCFYLSVYIFIHISQNGSQI